METFAPRHAAGFRQRRAAVEARLARAGAPAPRRAAPPEGRLGADDHVLERLADALVDLGPLFASFGRYLGSRLDLVPRRDAATLLAIPDRSDPWTERDVERCIAAQLGAPIERVFVSFDSRPRLTTIWTERHDAWLAHAVPALVTLVRPDAAAWLASDAPLLALLAPYFDTSRAMFEAAVEDFVSTLRRRLDQTHQAAAFATLGADASAHGGFHAPTVFRDHSTAGVLTIERPIGAMLHDVIADVNGPMGSAVDPSALAARVMTAWLRQTLEGRSVPFDFADTDVIIAEDRTMLIAGAFAPHASGDRGRFLSYLNAVSADDPDAAAAWIIDAGAPDGFEHRDDELRRRLRQAVPFRDGEWSGDDRLVEHVLVQWRMAAQAGWPLTPHRLHVYRGLHSAASMALQLAPHDDVLARALRDERIQIGVAQARDMIDPRAAFAMLDRALQDMIDLPQRLDNVLTLAAEGRLRVKLDVPDGDGAVRTRNRTVLLVAILVALAGVASVARHFAPAVGGGAERLAAVAVLILGGWLLVAAARA